MALKKEILFPFSALLDLWQQSALMPRAGLGSGRKGKVDRRLKWARSQQRAAALIHYPASFSHTAIFRYWALSAKKLMGGGGGRETKRVGPEADSFCLHIWGEKPPLVSCCKGKGSGETPPGPTQFAPPERAVSGSERRILRLLN